MTEPRLPLTYCSFASAIISEARALVLDGALTPMAAYARAKELNLIPDTLCANIQLIAYPVPPAPEVADWEYEAYLANRNRLIPLEEARKLFGAKALSEWEGAS